MTIDLGKPADRDVLAASAKKADVVIKTSPFGVAVRHRDRSILAVRVISTSNHVSGL